MHMLLNSFYDIILNHLKWLWSPLIDFLKFLLLRVDIVFWLNSPLKIDSMKKVQRLSPWINRAKTKSWIALVATKQLKGKVERKMLLPKLPPAKKKINEMAIYDSISRKIGCYFRQYPVVVLVVLNFLMRVESNDKFDLRKESLYAS